VLVLQKELRSELKEPLGNLYSSFTEAKKSLPHNKFIISVGDVTTKNLIDSGIYPQVGIIDHRVQRKDSEHQINYHAEILNAQNPPGTITKSLWETIALALSSSLKSEKNFLIIVDGEEDLAVLPCIILASKDTIILYGQPNEGVVVVNAADVKRKAEELINKFEEAY
jgi:uncharacterized protein (UPF0218 family)